MIFIYPLRLSAQKTASFEGNITSAVGEIIPGITVVLKNHPQESVVKGAITDSQGQFFMTNIEPGTYHQVEISGISYEKQSFGLVFKSEDQIKKQIILKESTGEMDEVVVTAESEARELELSAKSVQVIETQKAKLKSADLREVLTKTERVNIQRAGGLGFDTRFSLNGLLGDQIRFFYDGILLNYTPYNFGIANVPVNTIDRVEIYKGVVPIQFGADALKGAVNMEPPEIYDGWAGAVSYQFGSFNTHRVTTNLNYANEKSGLFAVVSSFYDYTNNDYKIDVAIPNEQGQLQQRTVRRFHDGYRAYGANLHLGTGNKEWAKELSIEGYYGDYDNEIQNSQALGLVDEPNLGIEKAVAGNPFGEVVFASFSIGFNLHYSFDLHSQWELKLKAGYNYNERVSIDTASNQYNWLGEVVRVNNQPGEFVVADHLITTSESIFIRQLLNYKIFDHHALKLSIAPIYSFRTGNDLLIEVKLDPALDDGYLFDVVTGLEYTFDVLNRQLQNISFVKNYPQSIRVESIDPSVDETLTEERPVSNHGAGNGLKYNWNPRFFTKLSYEYVYRLPRQDEIFGDGQLILENLELRPESSHNVNLQWNYANGPSISNQPFNFKSKRNLK